MFRNTKNLGENKEEMDPLLLVFMVLQWCGCWSIDSKKSWKRVLFTLYQGFTRFSFLIIPCLEIVDIFSVLDNLEEFNYNLCSSAGTIMLVFKMGILLANRENISRFQRELADNYGLPYIGRSPEDKKIMKKSDDFSRWFVKTFFIAIAVPTITCWCIIPYIDSQDGKRVTPIRAWFPFDFLKSPVYEVICIYESYLLYMYALAIIGLDMVFFCILPKFCSHLDILMKNLDSLSPRYELKDMRQELTDTPAEEAKTYEFLTRCIKHHQKIINQCKEFEEIFRKIVYIHFFGMSVLLCVEIFDIVVVPRDSFTIRLATQVQYFLASLADTYIYCHHGNRLIEQCEEVTKSLYRVPWYQMSNRCRRMVLQMMMRSQKTVQMTGGGRFVVNFATFLSVCKLSYNILAILEQMDL